MGIRRNKCVGDFVSAEKHTALASLHTQLDGCAPLSRVVILAFYQAYRPVPSVTRSRRLAIRVVLSAALWSAAALP